MGSAEEGGSGTQRVLLIGGPKHGDFLNLAPGQVEYEFTSDKMLLPKGFSDGWSSYPQTATHLYKFDEGLSRRAGGALNYFTHEVLWGSPYQGGFNLWALRDALSTIENTKEKTEAVLESQRKLVNDKRALELDIEGLKKARDEAEADMLTVEKDLRGLRTVLEVIGRHAAYGVELTGLDYESVFGG